VRPPARKSPTCGITIEGDAVGEDAILGRGATEQIASLLRELIDPGPARG
jgi:hypothetical protein